MKSEKPQIVRPLAPANGGHAAGPTELPELQAEEMDMAQLLAQHEAASESHAIENNSILIAKIAALSQDGVMVDIGKKKEVLIPIKEFGKSADRLVIGGTLPVLVISDGGGNRPVKVSWRAANERMAWEHAGEAQKRNLPIQARVKGEIKGGLLLECEGALTAFMPASHVDVRPLHDLKRFKGQTLSAYVVELDAKKNKLILSRKLWLSEENQKKKSETLAHLKTGDTRKGVVTGIASFGAFVDLGGIEGLLHIGELEWAHTKKVSDVLKAGQEIEVKILKFDPETEKISLSRKELLPHPWDGVESRFPAGGLVKGKVTTVTDFGAFVEIAPHVEGLLHASELSWKSMSPRPRDYVKAGQVIQVMILSVNREKEKISLSLKRLEASPWEKIVHDFPVGSKTQVTITNLVSFGAFARLPNGIEGLIHISDFSWVKRISHPRDVLKEGQETLVKILEIDPAKEKISFGIKQLKPNPYETYKKGARVSGPVTQVTAAGALVQIEPDLEGFVPAREISQEKAEQPKLSLSVGDKVEAKVILVNLKEKKIQLSIRQLEQELERAAVKKYSKSVPRPNLGELLE